MSVILDMSLHPGKRGTGVRYKKVMSSDLQAADWPGRDGCPGVWDCPSLTTPPTLSSTVTEDSRK